LERGGDLTVAAYGDEVDAVERLRFSNISDEPDGQVNTGGGAASSRSRMGRGTASMGSLRPDEALMLDHLRFAPCRRLWDNADAVGKAPDNVEPRTRGD
jgi:hypothetical protein